MFHIPSNSVGFLEVFYSLTKEAEIAIIIFLTVVYSKLSILGL